MSFLWLVAEEEVKEIQGMRRAGLEGDFLLMRWRCHRGGHEQVGDDMDGMEASWARTAE